MVLAKVHLESACCHGGTYYSAMVYKMIYFGVSIIRPTDDMVNRTTSKAKFFALTAEQAWKYK